MASLSERFRQTCNFESFVLSHGRSFAPRNCPERYRYARGRMKQCFCNAANAAIRDKSLIYVEGFASIVIPVLHAWCITKDGKTVELTWRDGDAIGYFGVPFQTAFLHRQLIRNKTYSLLDHWGNEFALLRGVYAKNEWIHPTFANPQYEQNQLQQPKSPQSSKRQSKPRDRIRR